MSQITILIADDQPLIRDGLAAILRMEERFTVVATTGDGLSAIELALLHRPQLILMDIQMPKLDGLEATRRIKLELPGTKVLILTTFEDEDYILDAIRHGASGFLVKGVETRTMLSTLQDCLDGRMNYPASIQARLVQAFGAEEKKAAVGASRTLKEKLSLLSEQERNIILCLKQGKSNRAIASELFLTTGTVKNYLSAIYRKLELSSRAETIAFLHETGDGP